MDKEEILQKMASGTATGEDKIRFRQWLQGLEAAQQIELMHEFEAYVLQAEIEDPADESLLAEIQRAIRAAKIVSIRKTIYRMTAAAAVLLFVVTGAYLFVLKEHKQATLAKSDVLPGHSGAILTLSNGKKIILDSARNGELAKDASVDIIKKDGEIAYSGNTTEIIYNTISTDKGRQWQLVLPDGSRVWLNAASSIHYPLSFTKDERVVEITGEAYFEVVHNVKKPFRVKAGNQIIEDIGTSFNVNAYQDEQGIKTTLITGAIKVQDILLKPGEAYMNGKIAAADADAAIAWKNGLFELSNADVPSIMRQVSRWYDIEIVYKGTVPKGTISGEVPRNLNLSEVLKVLALSGIRCEIDGKKLMVFE